MPVPRGYTASPMPTESDLMRIFKRLDRSGDGKLNRQELRRLLIPASAEEKSFGADVNVTSRGTIAPKRAQDAFLGCGTCLSPIDDCGVPMTEASVDQYLDKYSRITPGKVSFQEFSCMMLDLARR
jgi:Ca2+-binding EF-hand superfamily protein